MSGPEYDTDYARISACLALVELGKTDDTAKQTATKVLRILKTPTEKQGMQCVSGQILQEYARQVDLYMQKKKIIPEPLPTSNPRLTVEKYMNKR